jgi:hypothetical protein
MQLYQQSIYFPSSEAAAKCISLASYYMSLGHWWLCITTIFLDETKRAPLVYFLHPQYSLYIELLSNDSRADSVDMEILLKYGLKLP